jgi:hypothetical protein
MTLATLFRRKSRNAARAVETKCLHRELAPRWSSAGDIGRADLITHFTCTNCGALVRAE